MRRNDLLNAAITPNWIEVLKLFLALKMES